MATIYFFIKWIHVVFGILWLGHEYYLNFTFGKNELQNLSKKFLTWLKVSSLISILTGWTMLGMISHGQLKALYGIFKIMILSGFLLGTIMWINVWFFEVPYLKKFFNFDESSKNTTQEEMNRFSMITKTNVLFSFPLILFMISRTMIGEAQNPQIYWSVFFILITLIELNALKGHVKFHLKSIPAFTHFGVLLGFIFFFLARF
jgi:uncharacterized membrane protein